MKLHPEKLRAVLAEVEEGIVGARSEVRVSDDDYARFYHFDQLVRAGYLRAVDASHLQGRHYIVLDQTLAANKERFCRAIHLEVLDGATQSPGPN